VEARVALRGRERSSAELSRARSLVSGETTAASPAKAMTPTRSCGARGFDEAARGGAYRVGHARGRAREVEQEQEVEGRLGRLEVLDRCSTRSS
jgi:hypothetical protein